MTTQSITSGQKKQIVRFAEDALDSIGLDSQSAQRIIENGGTMQQLFTEMLQKLSMDNQFEGEEVESSFTYPPEYGGPEDIRRQVDILAKIFSLSLGETIAYVETVLPQLTLPSGAEGWFAIPRWQKVAPAYGEAVERVLQVIADSRKLYNHRAGQLGARYLREYGKTAQMLAQIGETQKGDILIVPAQFGQRHRDRSAHHARVVMTPNEFGLGAFAVGSMLVTHPDRLVRWEQLHVDCAGDEYDPDAAGKWDYAPLFCWYDGKVRFAAGWTDDRHEGYGSASAFIPQ